MKSTLSENSSWEAMMFDINEIPIEGYEKVIEIRKKEAGLHAIVAIHSTKLGPALGGIRIYPYKNRDDALNDVLRLAKGMTYKSALVELGLGGGKSVIIADPKKEKTKELLLAFGEALNMLKGSYIAAEDVGSTTEDMMIIKEKTPYVCALPTEKSSGDPSPYTAWGVYRGIQAVAEFLWDTPHLYNKTVFIQGVGHVGSKLADMLFWHKANLIFSDVDEKRVKHLAQKYGAKVVDPNDCFDVECDIFSPCALGGIINEETIPRLKCKAVAGSANNQLKLPTDGDRIYERGILYAPDFIISAGGIINASYEFHPEGYNPVLSRNKIDHIYDTLTEVFARSKNEKRSTSDIADEFAEHKIANLIGKRKEPIIFRK